DNGGLSLNTPACTKSDLIQCTTGGNTVPFRVSKRNVAAGSYRVVVADTSGLSAELMPLVRPTIAPVTVTADDCTDALVIPETGGFFTGDTSSAKPNFNSGCDVTGLPTGGANDHMLRLDLTQPRRVIFDMTGSTFTTVLDIRTGQACPGLE